MSWFSKNKNREVTVSPLTSDNDSLLYQITNLQGIGSRQRQEDSFTVANALDPEQYKTKGLMFCVCDGMGGMKDGKLASETAIASLRSSFIALDRRANIAGQLKQSVYEASDKVLSVLEGDGGSTVVIGIIIHEQLYFASVGDSFLYLKRGEKLIRLNAEHNLCHQKYLENIRDGIFDPTECRNDEEAAALTSFLGMSGEIEVDGFVKPLPLQKGDVILACSDGVGGVLGQDELLDIMNCTSVHQMSNDIEQHIIAHARPNQDNYTALLIACI
ncbi:MAG: serine/threonine-protein phosphatase [Clostridia bacterium]|nr:serine/threonine-protein phosphatase [Clostridia bacterium]